MVTLSAHTETNHSPPPPNSSLAFRRARLAPARTGAPHHSHRPVPHTALASPRLASPSTCTATHSAHSARIASPSTCTATHTTHSARTATHSAPIAPPHTALVPPRAPRVPRKWLGGRWCLSANALRFICSLIIFYFLIFACVCRSFVLPQSNLLIKCFLSFSPSEITFLFRL